MKDLKRENMRLTTKISNKNAKYYSMCNDSEILRALKTTSFDSSNNYKEHLQCQNWKMFPKEFIATSIETLNSLPQPSKTSTMYSSKTLKCKNLKTHAKKHI